MQVLRGMSYCGYLSTFFVCHGLWIMFLCLGTRADFLPRARALGLCKYVATQRRVLLCCAVTESPPGR